LPKGGARWWAAAGRRNCPPKSPRATGRPLGRVPGGCGRVLASSRRASVAFRQPPAAWRLPTPGQGCPTPCSSVFGAVPGSRQPGKRRAPATLRIPVLQDSRGAVGAARMSGPDRPRVQSLPGFSRAKSAPVSSGEANVFPKSGNAIWAAHKRGSEPEPWDQSKTANILCSEKCGPESVLWGFSHVFV
jgi:hypothetical protein